MLLWKRAPEQSLALLAAAPPENAPSDIFARRGVVQARALCRLGKLAESEAILRQTESLVLGSIDRDLRAELAFARGRCTNPKDHSTTEIHYQHATDLAHGVDPFIEASALIDLGYGLLQDERYAEAIDRFKEALAPGDSLLLLKEKALGNLGYSYSQIGDYKRAIDHSKQANIIASDLVRANNQENWIKDDQAKWLIDLGKAHFALREFPDAEKDYLGALSIEQQLHDRDKVALCLHNLSLLAVKRGDLERAEIYRKDGEALNSERERLHFALDAAEIASARQQFSESERLFHELLPLTEKNPVLRSVAQRDLGKVYWRENKPAQADQMFREGIRTAEEAMSAMKRPEYRMSFMDQTQFYDSYIQFLVGQSRPIEALSIAERSRAQVLAAAAEGGKQLDPSVSLAAVQAGLKRSKQVILTYSVTDEESFLWAITPSGFQYFRLPGHAEIFSQIEATNHEIQSHRSIEDSPGAQKLYETLVRPAEKFVPKGSSVVIVPSKFLSLLNFENLIVPGSQPHYWIEDVEVQNASSLALLAKAKSRTPTGAKQMLVLGAPVEASKDFPSLKHAPEEMERVRRHFATYQEAVISGPEATVQAYRANDPGRYRLIHFDTHGLASDLSPLESAIILSPGPDRSYKLYAREIKDIPLRADLVTISACYGAGTRWYQGEGLVGLAWAFMHAGAHQVIGALWEVDEASSPQLMDDFYADLTDGKSAAEALRAAKLRMLHSTGSYKYPYYWASLQLYTGS